MIQDPKKLYRELLAEGKAPKDAAKIAQERTGLSVVTGRPIDRSIHFSPTNKIYQGQYGKKI
jgi:hypothetical protein